MSFGELVSRADAGLKDSAADSQSAALPRCEGRRQLRSLHLSSPFGNRGAVTLSASASVLRMRGVRKRYSSVRLVLRSARPNKPPINGIPERIGTPPCDTSFC